MVLFASGAFLVLLGLFCAIVLTLAPLGLLALTPSMVLWLLFPLLCLLGFTLCAMAGRTRQVVSFIYAISCILLLLALTAVTGLVLVAASVLHAASSLTPLWYVLVVAGSLGAMGVASSRPAQA